MFAAALACAWSLNSTAVVSHVHNAARKRNVFRITKSYLRLPFIHEVVIVAQGPHASSGLAHLAQLPRVRLHVVDGHPHINARWNVSVATESFIMNDDDKIVSPSVLETALSVWDTDPRSIVATAPYRCAGDQRYNMAPCTGGNMVIPAVTVYPTALLGVYNSAAYSMAREIVRVQSGHCDDILASYLHTISFPGAPKVVCTCNGGDCTTALLDANRGISGRNFGFWRMKERRECASMLLGGLAGDEAVRATAPSVVLREITGAVH